MYLAGYIVCGFIVAGVYAFAWLRGRRDHYHRTALVVTLAFASLAAPVQVVVGDWAARHDRRDAAGQAGGDRGAAAHGDGARRSRSAASTTPTRGEMRDGHRGAEAAVAARRPRPERDGHRARLGPGGGPPAGQHRALVRSRRWSAIGTGLALLGASSSSPGCGATDCRARLVLPRGDGGRAAVVRRAGRGLDHHRGRAPAVDRLQGRCARARRSPRRTGSRSATRCCRRLRQPRRRRGVAAAAAHAPAGRGGGRRTDAARALHRPRDPRRDRLRGARQRRLRRRLLGPDGGRRRARRARCGGWSSAR